MFSWKKSAQQVVRDGIEAVYPRIWRYALALTAARDSADDLAQAVCLRAIERSEQFKPGSELDRWLFKITHNIWISDLRKEKVRRGNGLSGVELGDIIDPSQDLEQSRQQWELLENVLQLPEAQRQTVILVYVEGYAYKHTAEILDIPVGTVMSRLAAARKTLSDRCKDSKESKHAG